MEEQNSEIVSNSTPEPTTTAPTVQDQIATTSNTDPISDDESGNSVKSKSTAILILMMIAFSCGYILRRDGHTISTLENFKFGPETSLVDTTTSGTVTTSSKSIDIGELVHIWKTFDGVSPAPSDDPFDPLSILNDPVLMDVVNQIKKEEPQKDSSSTDKTLSSETPLAETSYLPPVPEEEDSTPNVPPTEAPILPMPVVVTSQEPVPLPVRKNKKVQPITKAKYTIFHELN